MSPRKRNNYGRIQKKKIYEGSVAAFKNCDGEELQIIKGRNKGTNKWETSNTNKASDTNNQLLTSARRINVDCREIARIHENPSSGNPLQLLFYV